MSTQESAHRDGPVVTCGVVLVAVAIVAAFTLLTGHQLGWLPDWAFGPGVVRTDAVPTPQSYQPPTIAAPGQAQPAVPAVPTAYVPSEQVVQFESVPPADMPEEQVQPRAEIVTVQRSEEQTTIVRTVPNKPNGPPIVVDKGRKCMGVCR